MREILSVKRIMGFYMPLNTLSTTKFKKMNNFEIY